jgi:hypothetical protein
MGSNVRAYAYDGLVSLEQLGVDHLPGHTTICRDGGRYVSFVDATRPAELDAMPLGWERYQAAQVHEKRAEARLLDLAKGVYPELAPAVKWPSLWLEVPSLDARHATRIVEAAA